MFRQPSRERAPPDGCGDRAFLKFKAADEADADIAVLAVTLDYRAPLAKAQGQRNIQNTLSWIETVLRMGPEAASAIDLAQAARFLGDALGVPVDLIRQPLPDLDLQPATTPVQVPLTQEIENVLPQTV
jgi:hypothetical protein